jgi:GT2 family glycosyltransferase
MSTLRVSIIVPAYNASDVIGDAIRAALNQTHQELELVVVDDGSTDDTAAVVAAIDDARIRYLYRENAGQSAAINYGVAQSQGDYIKLLDADDWIAPNHIEAQLQALAGHPHAVASCRWGYFVDDFTKPDVRNEYTNQSYDDPLEWLVDSFTKDEGMMGGWMWLIPRNVWDRAGGYDSRLSLNNDFHFSIALLLASAGVRFAADAVYSYRKTASGSLSGSQGRRAMESALLTTQLGTDLLLAREDSPRVRKICADRYQQWLFCFYPAFADLADQAQSRILSLGGSSLHLQGGRLLQTLRPLIGWKGVRWLQQIAYRYGWKAILRHKATQRLSKFE